jgi:serine/threonine protein kinase
MAPERFSGLSNGPAADVFSLGLMAVELMTGQLPSIDSSANPPIRPILSHEYLNRANRLLRGRERGRLCSVILSMLDPDPERRPKDYPALIATLEKM